MQIPHIQLQAYNDEHYSVLISDLLHQLVDDTKTFTFHFISRCIDDLCTKKLHQRAAPEYPSLYGIWELA